MGMTDAPTKNRLPIGQLAIICISRFGVPLMLNSFPVYLPSLLSNFDISAESVPYYVGVCSAIWSFTTCVTSPFWGRASDVYGRKPAVVLANILYASGVLVFGLAGKLWLVLAVMSVLGFAGGVTPVLHTTVAELVTEKELQPMAFGLIPLMWTIASMVGPMIGGFLVDPAQRYPSLFEESAFLRRFPYSLPNFVVAIPFVVGCVTGILFLKEPLKENNYRNPGLHFRRYLCTFISFCKATNVREKPLEGEYQMLDQNDSEIDIVDIEKTILGDDADKELPPPSIPISSRWSIFSIFPPSIFTRQSTLTLLYICFLQTHGKLFDEFLPTYLQAIPTTHAPRSNSGILSLVYFPGGLSLSPHASSLYLTAYGFSAIFIQLIIYPHVAAHLGPLRSLRIASFTYPIVYLLTPYLSLLPTSTIIRAPCIVVLLALKVSCGIFAFPCSRILLCNSATKGTLGTLNGISSSSQQLTRAIVAVGVGKLFSLGMEKGIIILPWWSLSFVSMCGAATVVWLKEEKDEEAQTTT